MEENGLYDEIIFYVEACESGAMFPKLRSDQKVFAATASDASHDSYAKYCSDEAVVKGVALDTCLGDAFSVAWIEDIEGHYPDFESIQDQWEVMK